MYEAHDLLLLDRGGGPRVVVSTAAFHARVRGSVPGLGGLKETKLFLPHPRVKVSIVGSLRDREVACSASDRQGSNFESCVWRTVSSQSSHHPQEVLLAQFSLYVHKGGLKPDSFHFFSTATLATLLSSCCSRGRRASFGLRPRQQRALRGKMMICRGGHLNQSGAQYLVLLFCEYGSSIVHIHSPVVCLRTLFIVTTDISTLKISPVFLN